MKELWKTFRNGYYEVSNFGNVRRAKPGSNATHVGRTLKAHANSDGYMRVTTYKNRSARNYYVHVLVARKFIGPCPKDKEVNHKDLDKANNKWTNLEYRTHLGNINHAIINGVKFLGSGEGRGNGQLTWKEVRQIRKIYAAGNHTQAKLGRKFGVTEMAIWQLVNNRTWQEKSA